MQRRREGLLEQGADFRRERADRSRVARMRCALGEAGRELGVQLVGEDRAEDRHADRAADLTETAWSRTWRRRSAAGRPRSALRGRAPASPSRGPGRARPRAEHLPGRGVDLEPERRKRPTAMVAVPAIGNGRYRPQRVIRCPLTIDVTSRPAHQRRQLEPGPRRARPLRHLEVERQERDRAEQREADDEADRARSRERPVAEERQRQDRLLRAPLDEHEHRRARTMLRTISPMICGEPQSQVVPPRLVKSTIAVKVAARSAAPA